jgi:P27 family predicted phage terminase small subunit
MAGNECSGRGGQAKSRNTKENYERSFKYNVPVWLEKTAREYWKRNLPCLTENNAISDKDYDAFCRLCDMYSKWRKCQAVTSKKGSTYETGTDRGALRIIKRPEAELEIQYHKEMLNLERKFGLNPTDGKGLKFKKEKKKETTRERYRV